MAGFAKFARQTVLATLLLALSATPGGASAFFAWRIADVAPDDLLNVRAYPSSTSRILIGYVNGTVLSLTGRCTGGVNLHDISHLSKSRQRQRVRSLWCEAWLDPTGGGDFRNGWVYGRYVRPA